MGGKVSRNSPDNEELSSPNFIKSPWLVKKTWIKGGKQGSFWADCDKKNPHPYPLVYIKGGRGDQDLLWGPEGIENILRPEGIENILRPEGIENILRPEGIENILKKLR